MLELITASGNISIRDMEQDYTVTHKYSGVDTLHFELSPEDPAYGLLEVEGLVHETTEDQTYVIHGIDAGTDRAAVDCELALDDWKADMYLGYSNHTASLEQTLEPVVPTGWSIVWEARCSGVEELNLEGGTPLDIFLGAQDKFDCAMRFDTKEQICRIYMPHQSPLGNTVLTEGAALLCRPQYVGKSTGLVTRLYPIGANGLTVEAANGGVAYIENHSFTDKVICDVWQDERYTIPEHLLAAARKKLKTLAVPAISWELSLADLYRLDPEQFPEHRVELFRSVSFQYGDRTISALCVQEEIHPHRPEHNTVYIGAVPASAMGTLGSLAEDLRDPNSAYNGRHAAAVTNATKKIVGSSGGHVVLVLDADGKPEELCVLTDTEDIATAQSLWRWNEGGLGHSTSGYNGEYSLALTKDGGIVADRITTGTLNADFVNLAGRFSVFSGSTLGGYIGFMAGSTNLDITDGIGICDASGECYMIATNEGVRMQAGSTRIYIVKNGDAHIHGNLHVTGTVDAKNISYTKEAT